MSHLIETHTDAITGETKAAFAAARQDAWHQLGTVIPADAMTAEQAMTAAHLADWDVRKSPVTTSVITDDGVSTLTVLNQYVTVRTNPFTRQPEPLGVVGSVYTPVQNEDHAEFLNTLTDQSGATFDTAGSLRDGREVFITMKLPEGMLVGGVDRTDLYIAALNSHDGTSPFRVLVTPIRVVCANTQSAALGNHVSRVNIRHTKTATARVAQAQQTLELTWAYITAFQAEAERMINETLTVPQFQAITKKIIPAPTAASDRQTKTWDEQQAALLALFAEADTQAAIRGTAWAGYQAVVEFYDHVMPVKTTTAKADARALRTITADYIAQSKNAAFAAFAAA